MQDLRIQTIDWSEVVFMLERKMSGGQLARRVNITCQGVGNWRRGVGGPCFETGHTLLDLIGEYYIDDYAVNGAANRAALSEALPRKGGLITRPELRKPLPPLRSSKPQTLSDNPLQIDQLGLF